MTILPKDEELHAFEEIPNWQESWYFNWSDPRLDVFGLARLGYNFKNRKIDGLILTIRNGRPEFVYPAVNLPFQGEWPEISVVKGLNAGAMVFWTLEPLKCWHLVLTGKHSMHLKWKAISPPFDYHDGGELPPNVTQHHFEQMGRVTGWTRFKDRHLFIDGYGQRDKSWGVRDWAKIEGWNWISAQFGSTLGFNVWEGFFEGKRYRNGFVCEGGVNHPVRDVGIEYTWDRREVPATAVLDIVYGDQKTLRVNASASGHFPLVKKGLWIQETSARFEVVSGGERLNGMGVIEHAVHAGVSGALKRFPEIFGTIFRLYRPSI